MQKIEFLSANLPYGLKVKQKGSTKSLTIRSVSIANEEKYQHCVDFQEDYTLPNIITNIIPIIRHLDTLTQECVQSDYNDGKPFIPVIHLGWYIPLKGLHVLNKINMDKIDFHDGIQLIKWHFWPNKPESEEVVYVTNEFNPYKT